MSTPISNRRCQANNEATCRFHRNGVMAGLHQKAADSALNRGDMDAAMYHADQAQAYRFRQDAVDAGDYEAVAEFTRADIAADKANANSKYEPVLPKRPTKQHTTATKRTSGFRREEMQMSSTQWRELQELAAKNDVQLQFEGAVEINGQATISNVVFKGAYNNVAYVHARVAGEELDQRKMQHEAELQQRRAANAAFSNAKRLVRSAEMSEQHWRRVQASANELGVEFEGGHYEEQSDGSVQLTNVRLAGGDTEVAAINNEIRNDTPTKIPSFEDFKRAFGFNKKAR
jgi:hypothetical protein